MKVMYFPAAELADGIASLIATDDPDVADVALAKKFYHSLQMSLEAGDAFFEVPQEDDETAGERIVAPAQNEEA